MSDAVRALQKVRLGLRGYECRAVFDGTMLQVRSPQTIELANQDLQKVAQLFGLRIF